MACSFSWIPYEIAESPNSKHIPLPKSVFQLNSFHTGTKPRVGASLHPPPPPPGQYSSSSLGSDSCKPATMTGSKLYPWLEVHFCTQRVFRDHFLHPHSESLHVTVLQLCDPFAQVTKWYWDALHSGLKYRLASSLLTSKLHQMSCSL